MTSREDVVTYSLSTRHVLDALQMLLCLYQGDHNTNAYEVLVRFPASVDLTLMMSLSERYSSYLHSRGRT